MKISFNGAAKQVTGSCILLETKKTKFLIDCGIFQGGRFASEDNFKPFSFDPKEINFVILTHAHADHCARLPKLVAEGFNGKIYSTDPTRELVEIIMLDSAKVMAEEFKKYRLPPLYGEREVRKVFPLFWGLPYRKKQKLSSDVSIVFRDAGHILGSAIVEVYVREGLREKKLVFSGDLGNSPVPVVQDTEFIKGAEVVFIESTYGGKIHEPADLRVKMLRQAILETVDRGGVLMIPVFALERTQEVLYELNYLSESRQIPAVPVFLDGPLSIEAIGIYEKYHDFFDKESRSRIRDGDDLFKFPGLEYTRTVAQSKKINRTPPPKIILAGGGMLNGGRMVFHLKEYLDSSKNHLLIISYQSEGSLGRRLLRGDKEINIEGKKIRVKAKVSAIGAYSSHADQPKLLHWLKKINSPKPKVVFIGHGEEKSSLMLADGIKQKLKLNPVIIEEGKFYEV